MRSIIAVVAGSIFIVVVIFFLQLAYIFIAVAYNTLAVDFPFLNDISGLFRYLLAIPAFLVTMFVGGYIAAYIANVTDKFKIWIQGLCVGSITVGGLMYTALVNSNLTLTGYVVIVLALSASSAGGFYWQRVNREEDG